MYAIRSYYVKLRYEPEHEPERVHDLYLAFEDVETGRRVLDDLRLDGHAA